MSAEHPENGQINPYKLLVKNPSSTFFLESEMNIPLFGINIGDILVVDREAPAEDGKKVVAVISGNPVVKKIERRGVKSYLIDVGEEIEITGREHIFIWGVVSWILRRT